MGMKTAVTMRYQSFNFTLSLIRSKNNFDDEEVERALITADIKNDMGKMLSYLGRYRPELLEKYRQRHKK